MGVRGLATYVNDHQEAFLENFLLHDCNLVVDGSNFSSQLYQRLNCVLAFGGDYDKIGSYVRYFFRNLQRCNVTPYVIFDGSHETKKLETVYSRLSSNIKGSSRLDLLTQGSLQIVPLLLRDVFKEALTDMNVPYTVCEFEADDEIAAMALHLNCPVLSFDSDFFIYNVLYIPFNTMKIVPKSLDRYDNKHGMECKIYRADHVTKHFSGIQEESLPLFATLLGNDYVKKEVFKKFYSELILPRGMGKSMQQRCIDGLLKWLQNETLVSAKAKVLGMIEEADRDRVKTIIEKSMDGYKSDRCESLKYLNINNTQSVQVQQPKINEIKNESPNEHELGVPTWFAERIRDNRIPKPYINLYTQHLYFCSPQAENYYDNDCFLCTLPILRYAFDIMTDFSQEYCTYVSREKDRDYKKEFIGNEYATPRPSATSFQHLTDEQLKSFFYHFLQKKMKQFDVALIETLPSDFQVFMIAILWWVFTCEVPLGHVHSLFICYVMLHVVDEKSGTSGLDQDLNYKYHENNNNSNKLEETKNMQRRCSSNYDLFLDKNKVLNTDCITAAHILSKHFKVDEGLRIRQTRYDIRKIHSFAQFQCCLLQFNSLNTLCRCPFENTKYCKSFNGTFVYNIAVMLKNETDPYTFFKHYLKDSVTVLNFYKSLCHIYQKCAGTMSLQNAQNNRRTYYFNR